MMKDEKQIKVFTSSAENGMKVQRMNLKMSEEQQIAKVCHDNESLTRSLMEKICHPANLNQAYKRVKANKGAAGIDGKTVDDLQPHIATHKDTLIQSLLDGSYQPQPVRLVEIPKADGGVRQLGIPNVVDRLVQQAILQVLQPIYESDFSNSSFGFRPGKSAHQAIKQAQTYVQAGYRFVVDIDIERFFDRVNHDILMSHLAERIKDKRLLKIIRRFLEAGIMQGGVCLERIEGMPQGGPLSPLLSNVLLSKLDKELERRRHRFCRYADDCNIYVKSLRAGKRVLASIKRFLLDKLRLKLNEEKSDVAIVSERQFLGFRLLWDGKISLAKKSEAKVKGIIRTLTKRTRGVSLEQVILELNEKLRGWINYFKILETPSKLNRLDSWIRRKLRCYRLMQRRRNYPIATFLINLGVNMRVAWITALSGKGWWRLSGTPAMQQAMSIEWFGKQRLINLEQQAMLLKR